MEKWLNSLPSQGNIQGFESPWDHHEIETPPKNWTISVQQTGGITIKKIALKISRLFYSLSIIVDMEFPSFLIIPQTSALPIIK